jgi:hypothetical protein
MFLIMTITDAARAFSSPSSQPCAASALHWLLCRDRRALSCDLSMDGDEKYVVYVIPLWDGELSIAETFRRPLDALQRHAEIVAFLRESGWLLADHGAVPAAA